MFGWVEEVSQATTNAQGSASAPGDLRFFERAGPFSVAELAKLIGIDPPAKGADRLLRRVAPLQIAGPEDVSFLDNKKYLPELAEIRAGAVIVHPSLRARVPAGCVALPTREPYLSWGAVTALFHPVPPVNPGVHPSAHVDPSAVIDPTAEIGPGVVIGARVEIGPGCRVGALSVISDGVVLGAQCRIGQHCTISHAMFGKRIVLLPGVRIGQDGFGFATTMTPTGPRHVGVPQLGRVVIEDDVEIGANSTIDRGSAQDTVIGAGTRIDNLVQIGHNVRIGRGCVIIAQVGISGSTVLEDFVVLAGQVGVAGHLRIGRGARVAGQAGVISNLAGGTDYMGMPAQPAKAFLRQVALLKRLAARKASGQDEAGAAGMPNAAPVPSAETGRN